MAPIRPEPGGRDDYAAQGKLRGKRNSGRSSRDEFDDPLHRAKLEPTIAVRRITGAVIAAGVVFAADMPEDLVYEIDARIFRVVSQDAFHTMPMAMKHEPPV